MRRFLSILVVLAVTFPLFAHGGEAHTYMGTVTMLHKDNSFTMKTKDGKEMTILYDNKTTFTRSDNHPARKSELEVGTGVVVKVSADGKTAISVKMSPPAKTAKKK